MICPRCQFADSKVIDSRSQTISIRRQRECLSCGHRFTTHERIERRLPIVVKKDGTKEPFDRNKIRDGLFLACRKRTVPSEKINASVDAIERHLLGLAVEELPSHQVGELVLESLQNLDMVAYVRFASVYRNIQTPKEFMALLSPWVKEND